MGGAGGVPAALFQHVKCAVGGVLSRLLSVPSRAQGIVRPEVQAFLRVSHEGVPRERGKGRKRPWHLKHLAVWGKSEWWRGAVGQKEGQASVVAWKSVRWTVPDGGRQWSRVPGESVSGVEDQMGKEGCETVYSERS